MPFGFLKKKTNEPEPDAAPFTARVDEFWRWFAANEQRIFEDLRAKRLDPEELSARIRGATPSLAWELCPSPEDGKEGLALSGEGSRSLKILVDFMVDSAPPLERWTLFTSKQPSTATRDWVVDVGEDERFAFSDFRFAVDFDAEENELEIQVHHPRFVEIPAEARTRLTFIALDSALGENLIETWVGPIDHTPERTPDQKYGIDELRRQARAALELHDLDPDLDGLAQWTAYSRHEQGDGDLVARDDVMTGQARSMGPIRGLTDPDYGDELEGSGACFAYVMVRTEDLESGRELDQRSELEDRLGAALRDARVGDCVGGALGRQYVYVDLVLFDESAAIEIARRSMSSADLGAPTSLRFFAPARRDEHVSLSG